MAPAFRMKKQPIVAFIILAVATLILSGCATVTRGTKDTLVIESDPAGADVRLSTGQTGKTPTSFKLSRKEAVVVTISREGYETVMVTVNSQIVGAGAAGMAGNVLVGGIVGVGVDAWTGATKSLKPNPVTVKLVRLEPKPAVAAQATTASAPAAAPPPSPVENSDPSTSSAGPAPVGSGGTGAAPAAEQK